MQDVDIDMDAAWVTPSPPHLSPPKGVASGPGDGDPLQGHPSGEHGRGAAGEGGPLLQPHPVCPAQTHLRVRQGAGPLPGLLRSGER